MDESHLGEALIARRAREAASGLREGPGGAFGKVEDARCRTRSGDPVDECGHCGVEIGRECAPTRLDEVQDLQIDRRRRIVAGHSKVGAEPHDRASEPRGVADLSGRSGVDVGPVKDRENRDGGCSMSAAFAAPRSALITDSSASPAAAIRIRPDSQGSRIENPAASRAGCSTSERYRAPGSLKPSGLAT